MENAMQNDGAAIAVAVVAAASAGAAVAVAACCKSSGIDYALLQPKYVECAFNGYTTTTNCANITKASARLRKVATVSGEKKKVRTPTATTVIPPPTATGSAIVTSLLEMT